MNKYLVYSTLVCVFASDNIYYTSSFDNIDVRLYYFIILINSLLLILTNNFKINSRHVYCLITLAISSLIGYVKYPVVLQRSIMNIWGISYVSLYFYAFFSYIKVSYIFLFKKYCDVVIGVCFYGYIELIYYFFAENIVIRFDSFVTEASVYCTLILPAYHYLFQQTLKTKKLTWQLVLLFLSIVISQSSLGLIGVMLSIIFSLRKVGTLTIALTLLSLSCATYLLYGNFEMFKDRVDSVVQITQGKDDLSNISNLNLSSFILLSNYYVAAKSVFDTYGLGNGLGSHHYTYKRTINNILGLDKLSTDYSDKIPFDAGSLFNRILSDLGIWGLFCFLYYIKQFRIRGKSDYAIVSASLLITILCRLIRDGRYFNGDLYFFIIGYYFLYIEYCNETKNKESLI